VNRVPINVASYLSPEDFRREGESILNKCWVFVGLVDEVLENGSYKPVTLWNRNYILTNDAGSHRLFLNTCPHRGSEIVSCAGKGTFTCPYHGWAFNSAGKVFVYNPKLFETVDRDLTLTSIKCASVGNFIFATVASPMTLEEYLGDQAEYLRNVSQQMHQRIDTNTMVIQANWKINVENTLEWYHQPVVHKNSLSVFLAGISESQYDGCHSTDIEQFTQTFQNTLKQTKKVFFGESEFNDYRHTLIFPNMTIATSSNTNFFIQQFTPVAVDTCHFVSHGFLPQFKTSVSENTRKQFIDSAVSFNRQVFLEDKDICEKVQLGLKNVREKFFDVLPSYKEKRVIKFVTDVQSTREQ
jgi:phenylpropionate dioxygenase-like ring-hydroxylating dioxygenase large terminal subunit